MGFCREHTPVSDINLDQCQRYPPALSQPAQSGSHPCTYAKTECPIRPMILDLHPLVEIPASVTVIHNQQSLADFCRKCSNIGSGRYKHSDVFDRKTRSCDPRCRRRHLRRRSWIMANGHPSIRDERAFRLVDAGIGSRCSLRLLRQNGTDCLEAGIHQITLRLVLRPSYLTGSPAMIKVLASVGI
jgi:hypothetical protein